MREEIRNGHVQSVDELIVQGVQALRERGQMGQSTRSSTEERRRAFERIQALRKGTRLERNGLTLREYAHADHKH